MSKFVPRVFETDDEDEDADLSKEVGDTYPHFQLERAGSAFNEFFTYVKVNGEFIGTLVEKHVDPRQWHIAFVARRNVRTYLPVASPEEGAQKLWQDHIGIIELPRTEKPYEPLPPVPDDPNHYESIKAKARSLVAILSEDEEDEPPSTPEPIRALQGAGFRIVESTGNKARISWPADDQAGYFRGIRRVKEVPGVCLCTEARLKNRVAELTVIFK